jgi:glycerol-1-phosphate dehydrogenase [NAD(P)+]
MPLLARTIATPVAIEVRRGAIDGLAGLLSDGRISAGGEVAVAVGPGQGSGIAQRLQDVMPAAAVSTIEDGTVEAARELTDRLREAHHDALVGIGGGKTLDVAKYAATMLGLPFVAVATSLAHDGLASPVASLASRHGRKISYGVHVPIAVFVDIDFVRDAPERLLRSGIGDVVSNLSAVADWELAARERGEVVDGLATLIARNAAEAMLGARAPLTSDGLLTTLAESLIASGLAMTVAGSSRPCSGACHEILHALDAFHGSPGTHGEQAAVGALFASWLRGDDRVAEIDDCLRRYAVPRLPADLGLDAETFARAVVQAPGTRPGRFTILEHLGLDDRAALEHVHAFIEALDR